MVRTQETITLIYTLTLSSIIMYSADLIEHVLNYSEPYSGRYRPYLFIHLAWPDIYIYISRKPNVGI